jgi:hypothetical protein
MVQKNVKRGNGAGMTLTMVRTQQQRAMNDKGQSLYRKQGGPGRGGYEEEDLDLRICCLKERGGRV